MPILEESSCQNLLFKSVPDVHTQTVQTEEARNQIKYNRRYIWDN